jgi:class 3 adenylate cyclase
MSGLEVKRFSEPDETVTFELGHVDVLTIGPLTVGLEVEAPGWRWSTHVRPSAATDRCEFHAGTDLRGVAVHLAARIMDSAGPGEVLVSATTRELASGDDSSFIDRGSHDLKGISGPRQLYEARPRGAGAEA